MSQKSSRRQWLKSSALLAAGLATAPFVSQASPVFQRRELLRLDDDLNPSPGLPDLRVRLLANENPYGPSPAVKEAIVASLSHGNRYPYDRSGELVKKIAEKEGVNENCVMLGPGSTSLLDLIAIGLVGQGTLLSADPTYPSLAETVRSVGGKCRSIPLTSTHAHDLKAMENASFEGASLVYICNPNNPTGTVTDSREMFNFCRKVAPKVPIFVDEAYIEYLEDHNKHSMMTFVREGSNVIISRTFSKIYGLAGIRMGYLVGAPDLIQQLKAISHTGMALSSVGIAAGLAALEDPDFVASSRDKNRKAREFLCQSLDKDGHAYFPPSANFVLIPVEMRSSQFRSSMLDLGVGIRMFDIGDKSHCRVSIGTMEDMEYFYSAFQRVVGA